jgi:hypothetical protein
MVDVFETQRLYAMSNRPQANYETATETAVPANFVGVKFTDKDFSRLSPATSDDSEDAHGSDFPHEEYLERWDVESPHSIAMSVEEIGRFLLLACGSVVTTALTVAPAPLVYQHVFTLQDANVSRQLPVVSLVELIGNAHNVLHPSMLLKMLSLKGDGAKRIDTTVQFHGSGKEIAPSGLSYAQVKALLQGGLRYFFNSQAKATVADEITLANAVDYGATRGLNSWELGINNNPMLDDGFRPGSDRWQTTGDPDSGQIRAEMLFGKREVTSSMVTRLRDQTERNALKARKKLNWKLELIGGTITGAHKRKLTAEMPNVRYDAVDIAGGGLMTQQIRMRSFGDAPVTFTLVNTIPSYVA